jgi:gamma-glutamylcyclotransferase (GGCT)/AIG2-like uncharacterized protein YtfP
MRPISARLNQANSAHSGQPDRPSAATSDLFVYGTLVLDQVISTLIDRVPAHEPVTAQGWRIARLPDRPYPGLVPDTDQAPGRLYTDLTDSEWATLDAFEDPAYTLTTFEVLPGPRLALAYTWPDEHLSGAWPSTASAQPISLTISNDAEPGVIVTNRIAEREGTCPWFSTLHPEQLSFESGHPASQMLSTTTIAVGYIGMEKL